MGLHLGDKQVNKLYVGDKEIVKAYLGDKIVYQLDNEPILFTRQEGHNLVINTNYPIPTRIYNMESGDSSETTTYLSLPLEIGNLTQTSYSDNYYYQPNISGSTILKQNDFTPTSLPTGTGINYFLQSCWRNMESSYSYPGISSGNEWIFYQSGSMTSRALPRNFTSTPRSPLVLNSAIITNPYSKLFFRIYIGYTAYYTGRTWTKFDIWNADATEILTSKTSDVKEFGDEQNQYTFQTDEIDIPTDGFNIQLTTTLEDIAGGGTAQLTQNRGKVVPYLKYYYYYTPLYCNISRTIFTSEEHPEYNEDRVEIMITSTDTNSLKMVSLSEDGVAVITDKENGGN